MPEPVGLRGEAADGETLQALDKIERLLRRAELDARLLDARDFKARPWAEAFRLIAMLREKAGFRG